MNRPPSPSTRRHPARTWLLLAFLVVFTLSCQLITGAPPEPTPSPARQAPAQPLAPTPTQPPAPTQPPPPPTPFPTVTPDPAQQNPPVAVAPAVPTGAAEPAPFTIQPPALLSTRLTEEGPWLLIRTTTGLYAANRDGSGLTRLSGERIAGPQTLSRAISSDGVHVAYITSSDDFYHNLTLRLLTLPGGEEKIITRLTSKNTEPPADLSYLGPQVEAVRAVSDLNSLAWSPDGKTLAFIGVMDGPSADLYTYSLASGKITRLTDGPSQAYDPNWSPDGKYIVQFGVNSFGTGAGYSMAGAWAARADGSGVIDLGKPSGSGEILLGWVNDQTFVAHSWSPKCGPENLHMVYIPGPSQTRLVRGCFSGAAVSANGMILVAGDSDMGSELAGAYAIDPVSLERRELSRDNANQVEYNEQGGDFVVTFNDRQTVYSNTGTFMVDLPNIACRYGSQLASYGMIYGTTCSEGDPGVWINGPGLEERRVFDRPATSPIFGWDNTLFFASQGSLYRAFFFNYVPEKVAPLDGDVQAIAIVGG